MTYKIITRENMFGGLYVTLEIDGAVIQEKYYLWDWYALQTARWLDWRIRTGYYKHRPIGVLYEGKIKERSW